MFKLACDYFTNLLRRGRRFFHRDLARRCATAGRGWTRRGVRHAAVVIGAGVWAGVQPQPRVRTVGAGLQPEKEPDATRRLMISAM